MPTADENLKCWNDVYDWPCDGDEWSAQFGGTEALWWFVIYPRIHRFIPAETILEIAPGHGRWTQFLRNQCKSMVGVDLSEKCIEHCKTRFASDSHIQFLLNDGSSLAAIPDASVDFAFSFDSLVHAEKQIIESYLVQLARKLKPDGVGFFHHSNIGAYPRRLSISRRYDRLPSIFRRNVLTQDGLMKLLSINLGAWRATSMTGALFRQYCDQAGLKCLSQELISWGRGACLIDGISVFAKPNSRWDGDNLYLGNFDFLNAAGLISRLAKLYCR